MSGITEEVNVHLKWGNLKFFDANHDGSGLLSAMRPFADGFVADRLGAVEKTWLIDESAGTVVFFGETEMAQVTTQNGFVGYKFRKV